MTDYTKWTIDKLEDREAEHHQAMVTVTNPTTHRALKRKRLAIRTEIDRRDAESRLMCQPHNRYDELTPVQQLGIDRIINQVASEPEIYTASVLDCVCTRILNFI